MAHSPTFPPIPEYLRFAVGILDHAVRVRIAPVHDDRYSGRGDSPFDIGAWIDTGVDVLPPKKTIGYRPGVDVPVNTGDPGAYVSPVGWPVSNSGSPSTGAAQV